MGAEPTGLKRTVTVRWVGGLVRRMGGGVGVCMFLCVFGNLRCWKWFYGVGREIEHDVPFLVFSSGFGNIPRNIIDSDSK
jgi:hypothetical protein